MPQLKISRATVKTQLLGWLSGKESACQCRKRKRCGFDHSVRKSPWSRKWQPTPVFLSGKSHEQRSLAGYSPWSHKELETTEHHHHHNQINKQTQENNKKKKENPESHTEQRKVQVPKWASCQRRLISEPAKYLLWNPHGFSNKSLFLFLHFFPCEEELFPLWLIVPWNYSCGCISLS